jgi:signal transduction histidine kinase
MTDNCTVRGEENAVEAQRTDEIAELRASRRRVLLAADAERRDIERALHDGVQQQLIGLATDLELASAAAETDPEAAMRHLEEARRGVRDALEEIRTVANRIYPALDAGGLAPALRFAAAEAGVRTRIDVVVDASTPQEVASAVYFCCLHVLGRTDGVDATITVRQRDGGLSFEIAAEGELDRSGPELRDRVEALGGTLDIRSDGGPRTVWAGFVPLQG